MVVHCSLRRETSSVPSVWEDLFSEWGQECAYLKGSLVAGDNWESRPEQTAEPQWTVVCEEASIKAGVCDVPVSPGGWEWGGP